MNNEEKELLKNLNLVGAQVKNFPPNSICDTEDYMQTGTIALLRALRKLDNTKGRLSTYSWAIIYREIRSKQYEKFKPKAMNYAEEGVIWPKSHFWEFVPDNLTSQEKALINLKLEGYNLNNIARLMKIKHDDVEKALQSAYAKIKEANGEN